MKNLQYVIYENNKNNLNKILPTAVVDFYLQQWSKEIEALNSKNDHLLDELYNARRVYVIFNENEPIGLHLATDHNNRFDHPYWNIFDSAAREKILQSKAKNIQSISHFIVAPEFRSKINAQLAIPKVLAALTFKNHVEYKIDFTVTVARRDIGVHLIGERFGGFALSDPQVMHNVAVSTLGFTKIDLSSVENNELFHQLWKNKKIVTDTGDTIVTNELKLKFDSKIAEISEALDNFPFHNKEATIEFFSQQYLIIQHTSRYLSLSASLIDVDRREEFDFWTRYLKEELNHDLLIKNDLKHLGYTFKNINPLPETRALIAANYYDIYKNSSYAILGYALMLEGLALLQCEPINNQMKKHYNTSFTYLKLHAEVDQEHYPEGVEKVSTLPHDLQLKIIDNLNMCSALYVTLIQKIAYNYQQTSLPRAA